ncbi:thiol:disulfide interchange protein DsbG [Comamonas thiooxydans]|uniref:Thiol:disulfide interchange protein n=2 Tax=Comamonas thiooxydans TaxID=363952 RepID=A0AA42Q3Z2_9BURK|nr:thiol:disulfide interchange protein DsbG [Comamonas thiooxydans]MDH1336838.1 thiol:disulfide interchange protein DsbG [Comamonas thiooxydans]
MTQDGQRFIVPRLQPLSRQWMALILPIFAAAAATVVAVAYTRDVIAASGAAASGAASSDLPSAQFLAEQGLQIVGPMQSSGGLKAWAAYRDQQPIPIYRMPDGKHWVIGTVIDAQGKDVNAKALHNAVQKPMGQEFWIDLERTDWIGDGKPDAARIAYVFTDPNCPYCNQLWRDARPLVQAGQLQLRHILVGMLRPSSEGKAAAILASKAPEQALASHAMAYADAHGKNPDVLGIAPLQRIPLSARDALANNAALMSNAGLRATPATIWKNAQGLVQIRTGMPPGLLDELMDKAPAKSPAH